jgi:hypothetical protein
MEEDIPVTFLMEPEAVGLKLQLRKVVRRFGPMGNRGKERADGNKKKVYGHE